MTATGCDLRSRFFDESVNNGGALAFAFALGMLGVVIPLIAVDAGYRPADIGVLVGISGVAQLIARLRLGALMRKVPDKFIVVIAGVLMAVSCGLLAVSTHFAVFVVSQLLQGVARAYFWTGVQTHAVRVASRSVGALSRLNLTSGIGAFAGPFVAGLILEADGRWAMIVAAFAGAVAAVFGLLLRRLPAFTHVPGRGSMQMWRRPEIRPGICMGTIAGAWRGLLNAYIPVLLTFAGLSFAVVGTLVAVANLAALVGGAGIGLMAARGHRGTLLAFGLATAVGTVALGPAAGDPILAAVCLGVSGIAAGALQTLGTAAVADAVHPEERGDAIATSGSFRAAALILGPLAAAGIVLVAPVVLAVSVVGATLAIPAFLGGNGETRHDRKDAQP